MSSQIKLTSLIAQSESSGRIVRLEGSLWSRLCSAAGTPAFSPRARSPGYSLGKRLFAATEIQPLVSQVRRLIEAMAYLGEPFSDADRKRIDAAANMANPARGLEEIQRVLDPHCLLAIRINPESRISVERAAAPARLVEQGWRAYLVKVRNEAGVTGVLSMESPAGATCLPPRHRPGDGSSIGPAGRHHGSVARSGHLRQKPMEPQLSGLDLEYRIVLLYSRDRGRREAQLGAIAGPRHRGHRIQKPDGRALRGRAISRGARSACATRTDGRHGVVRRQRQSRPCLPGAIETAGPGLLFPGTDLSRGRRDHSASRRRVHDHLRPRSRIHSGNKSPVSIIRRAERVDFQLRRWIDPPARGWYSGDHHIHAAGCSHYESPTEGVRPEDMMRHVLGEALSVGAVLNWGPSYYHQRQYFESKDNKVSTRLDAAFATTSRSLDSLRATAVTSCLLRLREQDYPDTRQIEDWPTWDLTDPEMGEGAGCGRRLRALRARSAGAKSRPAELRSAAVQQHRRQRIHRGCHPRCRRLHLRRRYAVRLRAEYLVSHAELRVQDADQRRNRFPLHHRRPRRWRPFLRSSSADADLRRVVRRRASGPPYVSDGFSHLMDFTANGVEAGTNGSELRLERPEPCASPCTPPVCFRKHRRASGTQSGAIAMESRACSREGTRDVSVEAIVNGHPVASQRLRADGVLRDLVFDVPFSAAVGSPSASSARPTPTLSSSCRWTADSRVEEEAPSGA